ncbi:MAG: ABC transporter permease subunit [Balneolaceae bacterium]|nr:ABC transporter permease subunit [Balneolaceae bacterium]
MKVLLFIIATMLIHSSGLMAQDPIRVGSKLFNESVILGEIITQSIENAGFDVEYSDQLGGTRILWNALLTDELDIYPDYTGTIVFELLGETEPLTIAEINRKIEVFGIQITNTLGFNNTYALGMRMDHAEDLGIEAISDLREHPELNFGFSNEFLNRADGWPGIQSTYNLDGSNVTGLDHDLAYRGLENENIDVIDLYSTDAEIDYYELKVLEDDFGFFPDYAAVIVYRSDLNKDVQKLLGNLEFTINEADMISMNADVKLKGIDDEIVAYRFLNGIFGIEITHQSDNRSDRLKETTIDHLILVGVSLALAILLAIPLGIAAFQFKKIEQLILSMVGILQTIPSLALLVFMIPLFGIGTIPAMAALFIYSLLPIVRNTHSGLVSMNNGLKESAVALGLPKSVILKKIELPLALPSILAGIKTSAVINVGTATLGALIGAGGYGQPILTGIRLDDTALILEGAIPAAVLALLAQWFFDLIEKRFSYPT